ncbi:MAG: type and secretion system protein [Enterovirga sp.]|jgi:pilus assembly protein CpaC|nr:type and secretion system protein [Enterovirga sp.]
MTITRALSLGARRFAAAALVCATALTGYTADAAEPPFGPSGAAPPLDVAQGGARRLDLSIGRSVMVELTRDAKEIFVANPAVANAVVRSTRKLFLLGVANGSTSVFVMDAEGRQIASLEVTVGRDLNVLRQTLRATIPSGRIDIRPAGDSILMTGTVVSAGDAQQAADIAKAFVGQGSIAGGAAGFTGNVINALSISGRDQVMLRVTISEVARSVVKQLGVNVGGNWNIINAAGQFANPGSGFVTAGRGIVGALSGAGTTIQGQTQIGDASVGGTLKALESAGVSRVLAEPTLVTVSGESANFLVGGEVPITIGCGVAACTPTVQFKQYGIQLTFTPIVLSEGRISLRVSTEVSEIDRENADASTGTPGFRTRKQSTSVELPSGATMMTAGLISSQPSQTISGVPGLINLPVLGALFRSRNYQRRESELVITVTPFIAKPMEAAQVRRPDDGFVESHDGEAVLLGRLNKLYGVAGPGSAAAARPTGAKAGRFGFITD